MTRSELLDRISEEERRQWMVLEAIEPYGERRLDLLHGALCALLANIHRGPNRPPFKAADFIPDFDRKPQTPEDMFKAMTGYMDQHNEIMKRKPS